ncbi:hypothetical protein RCL1_004061 [Eukaryota sp. TZLM3-RCL]
MPKSRITSTDLFHIVLELRSRILGSYLVNTYDIDSRIFIFKFHAPQHNETVMFESGIRFHSTLFSRDTGVPSGFTLKLRKHLRGRRLVSIEQVGIDRVVRLTFGQGELLCHLILDVFTPGNVVLLDYTNTIIACLKRSVPGSVPVIRPGELYFPEMYARVFHPSTTSSLSIPLIKAAETKVGSSTKKRRKGLIALPENSVGFALSQYFSLGPQYVDVVFERSRIDPATPAQVVLQSPELFENLVSKFNEIENILLDSTRTDFKGYILLTNEFPPLDFTQAQEASINIFEFISKKLREMENNSIDSFLPVLIGEDKSKVMEVPSFNYAVDICFSSIEEKAAEKEITQKQSLIDSKLTKIVSAHEDQVSNLALTEQEVIKKAEAIQENHELVELIVQSMRTCVESGLSWKEIQNLVDSAEDDGLGSFVTDLDLRNNSITVQLPLYNHDTEEEERVSVSLSLDLSALANVRVLYEKAKKARAKKEKTLEAHGDVVKKASKKAKVAVEKMSFRAAVVHNRAKFWFEKFHYFLSSENFIVVAGKDLQSNELLVSRYLEDRDVYLHSNQHGAASVVIKVKDNFPSNETLQQAGQFAVCHSKSWDQKVSNSAFWVLGSQVSKTAPTGMYLPAGSFAIVGKRNSLETSPLVMGIALLFKLGDAESILRHQGERRLKINENEEESEDEIVVVEEKMMEEELDETEKLWEEAIESSKITSSSTIVEHVPEPSFTKEKPKQSSGKKQISRFERRAMKKAKQLGITLEEYLARKQETADVEEAHDDVEEAHDDVEVSVAGQSKPDESEEELTLDSSVIDDDVEPSSTVPVGVRCFNCGGPHLRANCPLEKLTAGEKRKRLAQDKQIEDEILSQERQALIAEADLSSLTHNPLPEDTLLYVVPVVAPWDTLKHYKYRMKITPGANKKGRAATSFIEAIARNAANQREKELIKSLNPTEISALMPGKVSLSLPKNKKSK